MPAHYPFKNLCVYCGSNPGRQAIYAEAAITLGLSLAEHGIGLVYGGAKVGTMGLLADSALEHGGKVVGVIPEALVQKEVAHRGLNELHVTDSMQARKTRMAELADGFIALPGGLGTLEELFEVWTWAQLGFHNKPLGLLNVAAYYDPLYTFLQQAVAEQFIKPAHLKRLTMASEVPALLSQMATEQPPPVKKWLEQPQQL